MKRTSKYLSLFIISFLFTALVSICILPSVVFADPQWEYAPEDYILKYNYFNDEWEYAPRNSTLKYNYMEDTYEFTLREWDLKYNYMEDEWGYTPDDYSLKYNYMENEWVYAPDDYSLKYNYMDNEWEFAPSNSTLKYNYMEDNWKYVPDYTNNDSSSSSYSNNTTQNAEYVSKNTNSENNFLNNVLTILNEYNLAVNHMNTYHKDPWIFNDPNEIALEVTFLVKLEELLDQLKNIKYPSSFTNKRNNFISIFEEICYYKGLSIEYSKNNDFNNCVNNENAFNSSVDKLFNYYNSLI